MKFFIGREYQEHEVNVSEWMTPIDQKSILEETCYSKAFFNVAKS